MTCNVTPEQELLIIKTILALRSLGDTTSSERLRGKIRRSLLDSPDDDAAVAAADQILRRYTKLVKKLDGTYERERELKRRRGERTALRASRFVDDQAESDDDTDDGDSGDDDGGDHGVA